MLMYCDLWPATLRYIKQLYIKLGPWLSWYVSSLLQSLNWPPGKTRLSDFFCGPLTYILPWTVGCWHHYATCIFIKRIWCIFFPQCVSFLQLISMKSISITCFMVKRKISKLLHTQCMTNITCNNILRINSATFSKFQICLGNSQCKNVFCNK